MRHFVPGPMNEASFFLPSRSSPRIVCFSPLNCGLSCTLFLMAVATDPLNALLICGLGDCPVTAESRPVESGEILGAWCLAA